MKFLFFLLFLYSAFANAQNVYITDQVEIPFRSEPIIKSDNLIKRLESGSVLELVRFKDGWAEVRYQGKTGWIIGRYLSFDPPAKFQLDELKNEITYLQSVISELKYQNPDTSMTKSNEVHLRCSYTDPYGSARSMDIVINKELGTGTNEIGQGELITKANSYEFTVIGGISSVKTTIDRNNLSYSHNFPDLVFGTCKVVEKKVKI